MKKYKTKYLMYKMKKRQVKTRKKLQNKTKKFRKSLKINKRKKLI